MNDARRETRIFTFHTCHKCIETSKRSHTILIIEWLYGEREREKVREIERERE